MYKAFKYPLCPNRQQAQALGEMLETHRHLHNRALAELKEACEQGHRIWPETSAAEIVEECRGLTSRELRTRYPDLKRKLHSLWTCGYFASTADNVSAKTIERYIGSQKRL
jgi:REP element-mobilizing transposase RayT